MTDRALTGQTVVLVHGLWMNGMDMSLLRLRIRAAGYATRRFSYRTVTHAPPENARRLQAFIQSINSPVIHFVCHSLGGLVIRHLFHQFPDQKPGRVITLGTPHQGSHAARQLLRWGIGHVILGKSIENGLTGEVPPWTASHDLGVIAGTLPLGIGMIVPGTPRPHDSVVPVAETRVDGMRDHITVRASHIGLLLSAHTARQTLHFLGHGRFSHADATS